MKRTLSLVLALVMVLGTFTSVFAADTANELEAAAAEFLKSVDVLEGNDDGDLMLGKNLERRDMVVLLSRLLGDEEIAEGFPHSEESPTWEDVRSDAYYVPFLAWAQANGYFEGHDEKTFGPRENITAQDFATVLLRALGHEVNDDAWKVALETVKELGILEDVEVENKTEISRGQMALMTLNALEVKVKDSEKTLAETLNIKLPKPAALEAVASASNLKQVTVKFNQKVDKASAENKDNYSLALAIESAELQEDGSTVVLTLDKNEEVKFEMQKEYTLKVSNVENYAKTLKPNLELKFRAVDVTIPTVKEVVALGTKAVKVVFSEPVKQSPANSTTAYRIDGKFVAGSVKYVFPNEVIISTNLTVGEHTLSVTGVKDFYNYEVQEPGFAFIVAEDTDAPEVVSAQSVDLKQVVVEFNEPVKSITRAYHTSTANLVTAPIEVSGNKVTLNFNNSMSLGNTTIYLEGVEDYSGNKANRNVTITPELDMSRPEVVEVKVKDAKEFTILFNKSIEANSAKEAKNYVLRKADGTVVKGNGLNVNGNPVTGITTVANGKGVKFSLVKALAAGSYTIEIAGVRDNATIQNIMLPYSHTFEIGDMVKPEVSKVWINKTTPSTGKHGAEIYVQFSKAMAVDGEGSVLDLVKYNYSTDGTNLKVMPNGTTVELVANNTVRLVLPTADSAYDNIQGLRVVLVKDLAGNWIEGLMTGIENVNPNAEIAVGTVKAVSADTVEVQFDGILAYADQDDFVLTNGLKLTYEDMKFAGGKTTVVFKLDKKLSEDAKFEGNVVTLSTKAGTLNTQDAFGNKIATITNKDISDSIKPTVKDIKVVNGKIEVEFNEAIEATNTSGIVTVKIDDSANKATAFVRDATDATKLVITADLTGLTETSIIEVSLLAANNTVKAITDASTSKNVPDLFNKYVIAGEAGFVADPTPAP